MASPLRDLILEFDREKLREKIQRVEMLIFVFNPAGAVPKSGQRPSPRHLQSE
jgi:hypothetical protein